MTAIDRAKELIKAEEDYRIGMRGMTALIKAEALGVLHKKERAFLYDGDLAELVRLAEIGHNFEQKLGNPVKKALTEFLEISTKDPRRED